MTQTRKSQIKKELLALSRRARGLLRVADVHAWAKANTNSALYHEIEWDTKKAAYEYQLWQIRRLINIYVIDDAGAPQLVNLTIDRTNPGGGYRSIGDVLDDRELSGVMLADALEELKRVKLKYERVKELTAVWDAVEDVARKATRRKRSSGAGAGSVAARP